MSIKPKTLQTIFHFLDILIFILVCILGIGLTLLTIIKWFKTTEDINFFSDIITVLGTLFGLISLYYAVKSVITYNRLKKDIILLNRLEVLTSIKNSKYKSLKVSLQNLKNCITDQNRNQELTKISEPERNNLDKQKQAIFDQLPDLIDEEYYKTVYNDFLTDTNHKKANIYDVFNQMNMTCQDYYKSIENSVDSIGGLLNNWIKETRDGIDDNVYNLKEKYGKNLTSNIREGN